MKLYISILITLALLFSCQTNTSEKKQEDGLTLNPNAPIETEQFGQLVGEWSCVSKDLLADSTTHTSKATWLFRYILDGYAIEDVWMEKVEDKTNNTIKLGRDFQGKNIRIYNPQLGEWQCVWIDNRNNSISSVWRAYYKDGAITMHDGTDNWRIVFHNIQQDSFDWKYEVKQDDNWLTPSTIKCTRQ